jgi:hypothetical protein
MIAAKTKKYFPITLPKLKFSICTHNASLFSRRNIMGLLNRMRAGLTPVLKKKNTL